MPAPLIAKDEVIARITKTFKTHGYDGASLAELSRQTGLVKASLYHYFPDGKKHMAEAALDAFGRSMADKVIAPLQTASPPRQRLAAMLSGMNEVYDGGTDLCLLALLSIGDTRSLFHEPVKALATALSQALAQTLRDGGLGEAEASARTEQTIVAIEGALVMSRVLADPGVFQRTLNRLGEGFEVLA